ncbi:hypothetical protein LUR56_19605 [Streptomyces sp. MT29]|nr:hypothetical protein [Streptomyces sp. MT29]
MLWSPARIVGEAVLAVTLAGFATGIGAWGDTLDARTVLLAGAMALLAPARHALPATVLILSAPLAGGWSVMASVLLACAPGRRGGGSRNPGGWPPRSGPRVCSTPCRACTATSPRGPRPCCPSPSGGTS